MSPYSIDLDPEDVYAPRAHRPHYCEDCHGLPGGPCDDDCNDPRDAVAPEPCAACGASLPRGGGVATRPTTFRRVFGAGTRLCADCDWTVRDVRDQGDA